MDFRLLAEVIGALVASGGIIWTGLRARRELDNNSAKQLTDIALSLVDPLEKRVDGLEADNTRLRARIRSLEAGEVSAVRKIEALEIEVERLTRENAELHEGIALLMQQIVELGQEPRFSPAPKRRR